jgi:tetratricopeptide (TPR) repeat protein
MNRLDPPPSQSLCRLLGRLRTAVLAVCLLSSIRAEQAPASMGSIEQMWAEATAAQQSQQYDRAADLYRKILAIQPNFTEAEVNLGIMLHLAGKPQEAVACFDQVLSKHPDLLGPNLIAGLDDLKLDNPQAALPHLQRAVRLSPENIEARVGLANSYLQLKQYAEALDQFTRATKLNTGNAEAWYGMGATYLSIEKETESDLHRSASPFRTVLLGESYLQQGQLDKGIGMLSSVVTKSQTVPCARSILGFAYLQQARFADAEQQFDLDWNTRSGEGCLLGKLGIASLDEKKGDTQDALREVSEAAAIDPAFVATNASLYLSSLTAGGEDSKVAEIPAKQQPEPQVSDDPESDAKKGHYSACVSKLAQKREQLDAPHLRLLCFCSYSTGQDEVVMAASSEILKQLPSDSEALYWRVQSTERLGLAAITRASVLSPDSVSLHALMGDLLQAKGDLTAAATEYRKAIAIKPSFLAAHLGLARTLNSDHKTDEAEQEVRSVLDLSPDDAEANYLMGEILVNRSALANALPFLLKALHAAPEELPYVHADLGKVYEDQGETAKAIAEMKQAVSVDEDGSFYYRLGRLYLKAGDRKSADEAFAMTTKLRNATDAASKFVK